MNATGWCVYLLRCGDGSLYTGVSNDVLKRVAKHQAGTGARYTRSRPPVALVYVEPQPDRSGALRRELAVKALPKAAKEALVTVRRKKTSASKSVRRPKAKHADRRS